MKASEIRVGEHYVHTRSNDVWQGWGNPSEVEVIETGILRLRSRVRFVEGGQETLVQNRELKMPWDEYEAEKAQRDESRRQAQEARDKGQRERAARAKVLDGILARLGVNAERVDVYSFRDEPAVLLREVGYEVTSGDREYVMSAIVNLRDYVRDGDQPIVKAESIVNAAEVERLQAVPF